MMHLPQRFEILAETEVLGAGQFLRRRGEPLESVLYLESGRVLLGVSEDAHSKKMRQQLFLSEGPIWLDAAFALAARPCCLDILADTRVRVRRVALQMFLDSLAALPATVQTLLHDMAVGYCAQTETAVSRLAQAAEARFAQWLLRHAQHADNGTLRVTLNQRKRSIAAQLGITPETFSRVLRQLREHGLVAGSGNVLNLTQPDALQSMAGI